MNDRSAVQTTTANLVPVFTLEIGGRSTQAVNARELHQFLGVKRDFTTWIKKRIEEYGFLENHDYLLTKTGEQLPSGTKYLSDYHITLDTAKEISMVEKNEAGRTARRYFIDCERQLHTQKPKSPVSSLLDFDQIMPLEFQITPTQPILTKMRDRILQLLLEKRDAIFHPDLNSDALWSVTLDIHRSLSQELIADFSKFFLQSGLKSVHDQKCLDFANNWLPASLRNR